MITTVIMPACDWGPCTCCECRERAQSRASKIYSDCRTRENSHLFIFYMSSTTDRKGLSGYDAYYRCPECDVNNTQSLVLKREEKRLKDENRARDRKLATATFFKHVRELENNQWRVTHQIFIQQVRSSRSIALQRCV